MTQIVHTLVGTTRTFNYDYYPNSDDRKWTQRLITPNSSENNKGEVFSYDQEDQVTAVLLDIASPNTASPGNQSIFYDSNGNRNWYAPPGVNKHYDPDANHPLSNLNQYTGVIINGSPVYNLTYRADANLAHYDNNNSTYNYDAQNRLTIATVNNVTMYFAYDGLNRQVSRKTGANGTPTYNVWDGWDLIEEYQVANHSATTTAAYVYGAGGLIAGGVNGQSNYYYQDGSGSTALLSDSIGHLLEWYRYDLDGTPMFYNPNDMQRNPNQSGYGVRHLFTGQQWYQDIGLYDMRNRFYSPDLGRFLQPDPIGFRGGNNLYRYCGNNPVTRWDPFGLQVGAPQEPESGGVTYEPQIVNGDNPNIPDIPNIPDLLLRPPPDVSSIAPSPLGGAIPPSGGGRSGGNAGSRASNNSTNPQDAPSQNPSDGVVNLAAELPGIVTVGVTTAIEGGPWAGFKSYQWATVNPLRHITSQGDIIGYTYNYGHGTYDQGYGQFRATTSPGPSGTLIPIFNILMEGHAWSADLPEQMAIDYLLNVQVNLNSGTASISGRHDGYPSYTVTVNGQTLYYFHEHSLFDLLPPMEVEISGGR